MADQYSCNRKISENFNCRICSGKHGLKSCSIFLWMSVEERMSVVRQYNCCWTCLAFSHSTSDCKAQKTCVYCGDLHNSLLHQKQYFGNSEPKISNKPTYGDYFFCRICGERHGLKACHSFLQMSVKNRMSLVCKLKCCWVCLAFSHATYDCTSKNKCKRCGELHNTLLHRDPIPQQGNSELEIPDVVGEYYCCVICGKRHGLKNCRSFLQMSVQDRKAVVSQHKFCWICLAVSHLTNKCTSTLTCQRCHQIHNTLLHSDPVPDQINNEYDNSMVDRQSSICQVCLGPKHLLCRCRRFRSMTKKKRMEWVCKYQHCLNCLSDSHVTDECRSKQTCTQCGEKHNNLLHQNPSTNPSDNSDIVRINTQIVVTPAFRQKLLTTSISHNKALKTPVVARNAPKTSTFVRKSSNTSTRPKHRASKTTSRKASIVYASRRNASNKFIHRTASNKSIRRTAMTIRRLKRNGPLNNSGNILVLVSV